MKVWTRLAAATLVSGAVFLGGPAAAGPEDVANDISAEVVSPFCPGVTLHDCPSAAAVDLRNKIETWLEAGSTRQEVLDRLKDEYGTTIYAAPEAKGTGLFAYVLPAAAVLGGLGVVVLIALRWTNKRGGSPSAFVSEEDRARLDAELRGFRSSS
jgi:cytochrome c-type biogenesis protein CcmH/NrfF